MGIEMRKFRTFIKEDLEFTLQYHDDLNPAIWEKKDKMKPLIKDRLLHIGELWATFSKIPADAIKDIVLTGGNANFNYTPYSDLDVHVLIDYKKLGYQDREFMDDFFASKKILWAVKHQGLRVMGYPVELYAQDYVDPMTDRQGVFSLKKNKWLQKPKHERHPFHEDIALKDKIQSYIDMIEKILVEPGDHSVEVKTIKDKLAAGRSAGLHQAGEFSNENILFKELRNRGLIDKMKNYIQQKSDEALSVSI